MANKNIGLKNEKVKAGFLIILISVFVLTITIVSGGIYFLGIEYSDFFGNNTEISGNAMNATVSDVDALKLFEEKYYFALENISNTIAYGTTWLELCESSQTIIDGEVYIKVCNDDYTSVDDVKILFSEYLSEDLIDMYMSHYYKEYNGRLYVVPFNVTKNDNYVGLKSYSLKQQTSNKLEFNVTSTYSELGCNDSCKYTYKTQKFVLEKQKNNWIVTEIELPY